MERASHPYFQFLFVVRGCGVLHLPDARFSLQSGDLCLLPPQVPHAVEDETGAPLSIFALNLAPELFPVSLAPLGELPVRLRRDVLRASLPDLWRRMLLEQALTLPGFESILQGLALQLLGLARRTVDENPLENSVAVPTAASHARVATYIAQLERTFYRAESVDAVSARLGLSRRRFTDLFRELSGESWLERVRRLRIEHAQRLLRGSNRTVLSVAFECGYEDASSFHRAFKAVVGTSPDAWRNNQQ